MTGLIDPKCLLLSLTVGATATKSLVLCPEHVACMRGFPDFTMRRRQLRSLVKCNIASPLKILIRDLALDKGPISYRHTEYWNGSINKQTRVLYS
jgi:hypothetical protein